jgi:diguanylate cyclase (GGDEF)-like protein/PAS domain S-box-containing protein
LTTPVPDRAAAAASTEAAAPATNGPNVRLVRALCIAAGMAGLVAFVVSLSGTAHPWSNVPVALLLVGAVAVLQVMPVRLSHEGEGENLHLEEAFLVAMVVYLTAPQVVAGLGVAVAIGQLWHRRGWMKTLFNTGELMASVAVGTLIAHLLGAGAGVLTDRAAAAAVAGVFTYSVFSMLAVALIMSVVQRTPFRSALVEGLRIRATTWVSALAGGVLIATAIEGRSWMLPVATLPVAMLQVTCSRSFRQYAQRRQMEKLYSATTAIRDTTDSTRVREQLVRATYTLLDAGTVKLVPTGTRPSRGALHVSLDDHTALEVGDRLGGGDWDRDDEFLLRAVASVASNALSNATLFEQVRTITASLGEGVLALDREGRIEFVNPAVEAKLGWSEEDLLGRTPHQAFHVHEAGVRAAGDCRLVLPLAAGMTVKDDDGMFTCKDGSVLPVAYTTSPVVRDGLVVGAVIAFRDITERKSFEQQLRHQAFHDALTGLPNRALFLDRLGHAQARMARTGALYSLLFIDLDRFKVVNDSLGHHVGDELLLRVSARLAECLRAGDTLARFGGDEFVALIEDLDSEDEPLAVAQRLLDSIRHPFQVAGRDLAISCSIGVVIGDRFRDDPDECLREGDVAMYRAKAKGKACFEVSRSDSDPAELRRLDLEIELRGALERDELELHYQPIVSVEDGRIVGLEALLRWNHPTRGAVPPAEFIPLAEESGLILTLGRWVLHEACRQVKAWEESCPGVGPLTISVNLSPRQFRQPDLTDQVGAAVQQFGLRPKQLCMEVTEGVMVDDVESATVTLGKLQALGVSVSIDDFGTGYSSLSYLQRFPIDYVKIDRSFIVGLADRNIVDTEIVRSVIRLAAAIGIQAVAEGVETESQLLKLRDLDCPLAQGYHFARPQAPADIERMFRRQVVGIAW